jgi:hypothetical protein
MTRGEKELIEWVAARLRVFEKAPPRLSVHKAPRAY